MNDDQKAEPLITLEKYNELLAVCQDFRTALEFYADKENWDDDQFNPTVWDDGKIDMGYKAREVLKEKK